MTSVAAASGLRVALSSTGGTVTDFLEHLVGEPIEARGRRHERVGAPAANDLGVEEGGPLLHRAATLQGSVSGNPYVYAESVIAMSRLPTRLLDRLETSNDPIGRILEEAEVAVTRVDIEEPSALTMYRPTDVSEIVRGHLLTRTYRIDTEQTPLMIITEWFLGTLIPFLP
jgi:chorismate-pyruvate lyase